MVSPLLFRMMLVLTSIFSVISCLKAQPPEHPPIRLEEIPDNAPVPTDLYITDIELKQYTLWIFPYFGGIPEEINSDDATLSIKTDARIGWPVYPSLHSESPDKIEWNIHGPGGGQYIELILDDDETTARISTNKLIDIPSSGEPALFRAYLCKPNGECYKDTNCFRAVFLPFEQEVPDAVTMTPIITYNLPRAVERTRTAVLDFMLDNVPMNNDRQLTNHFVRVVITHIPSEGQPVVVHTEDIREWAAHDITGLQKGNTYRIDLEIYDNRSQPVRAQFSKTHRIISTLEY